MIGALLMVAAGALVAQATASAAPIDRVPPSIAAPRAIAAPGDEGPTPAVNDRDAFNRAAELVGRDADGHVRLAIWAEQAGWTEDRARHLSVALLLHPGHVVARAMLGQVREGDRWVKAPAAQPAAAAGVPGIDPARLDEYARRRAKARRTVPDQLELATWCEQNGLAAQAQEHLVEAVRIDPSRDASWKRLGYKKVSGRWVTAAQAAQFEAFRKAQAAATAHWKPVLTRLRKQLGEASSRDAAQAELADLADPLAVPSVLAVFGNDPPGRRLAVRLLGQLRGPASSQALAMLAIETTDEEVVRIATETLAHRDPREFAGKLVAMIAKPTAYEAQGLDGTGGPGSLRIETPGYDLVRQYRPSVVNEPNFNLAALMGPGEFLVWGPDGMPYAGRYQTFFAPPNPKLQALGAELRTNPGNAVATLTQFAQTSPTGGTPVFFDASPGPYPGWGWWNNPAIGTIDPLAASGSYVSYRPLTPPQVLASRMRNAMALRMAQEQLEADVQSIESRNSRVRAVNERVIPILTASTGQDFGPNPAAWRLWWNALLTTSSSEADPAASPPMPRLPR